MFGRLVAALLAAVTFQAEALAESEVDSTLPAVRHEALTARLAQIELEPGESRDCIAKTAATLLAREPEAQVLQERSTGGLSQIRKRDQNQALQRIIAQTEAQDAVRAARAQCK